METVKNTYDISLFIILRNSLIIEERSKLYNISNINKDTFRLLEIPFINNPFKRFIIPRLKIISNNELLIDYTLPVRLGNYKHGYLLKIDKHTDVDIKNIETEVSKSSKYVKDNYDRIINEYKKLIENE